MSVGRVVGQFVQQDSSFVCCFFVGAGEEVIVFDGITTTAGEYFPI